MLSCSLAAPSSFSATHVSSERLSSYQRVYKQTSWIDGPLKAAASSSLPLNKSLNIDVEGPAARGNKALQRSDFNIILSCIKHIIQQLSPRLVLSLKLETHLLEILSFFGTHLGRLLADFVLIPGRLCKLLLEPG